jgi:hypothetical protein
MHIWIAEGAGFIGSRLAQMAIQENIDVTVLDDLSTGHLGIWMAFWRGSSKVQSPIQRLSATAFRGLTQSSISPLWAAHKGLACWRSCSCSGSP